MARTNFAAISRVEIKDASRVFAAGRDISQIAEDCASEALKVLYDGLSNPDDKLRLASATALVRAHCQLASIKAAAPSSAQLGEEEREVKLRQALLEPDETLKAALGSAGWVQVQDKRLLGEEEK